MRTIQTRWWVVMALLGALGCGDDDGVDPPPDAGDDGGPPQPDAGAEADAGGEELTTCDLRDPEPCPGDAHCVGYTEWEEGFIENPERTRPGFVCRDGLRIAEGLPCMWERLPDRDATMREIDPCAEGMHCSDGSGFDLVCRRRCGPDLAVCDAGFQCVTTIGFGAEQRIGSCVEDEHLDGCDPVLQTGCGTGEQCWVQHTPLEPERGVGFCYPTAGLPAHYDFVGSVGRGCRALECSYGQACVEQDGEWRCQKLCDTTGASTGASSPDGASWGTCPPSAPTCVPLFTGLPTPAGFCSTEVSP